MESLPPDQVSSPDDQPSDLRSPLLGADEYLSPRSGLVTSTTHKVKKKFRMRAGDWAWAVLMMVIILAGIALVVLASLEDITSPLK
jgi:hypothetical protein